MTVGGAHFPSCILTVQVIACGVPLFKSIALNTKYRKVADNLY